MVSLSPSTHPRSKRRLALIASSILVIVGGIVGIGVLLGTQQHNNSGSSSQSPSDPTSKATTLDEALADVISFDITTTALGELKAKNQRELRNELESESSITEIVPEGMNVKKGDVLVRLNDESIRERLEEAQLQHESAKAAAVEAEQTYEIQLSENESSFRAAELKLQLAELDLAKWRQGEVESKRQELDHELDRTTKDEQRLREKVEKSRELQSKGYYSLDQFKQDELAWEQAQAALAKAQLAKEVYWKFEHPKDEKTKISAVDEAKAELERTKHQNESKIASKEADKKNKLQTLTLRQITLEKYQQQLEHAVIIAPQDGLVVYATSLDNARWGNDTGPLQVGSKVYINQSVIVLPDTSEMVANVRVHESLASRIHPGQHATIKVDAAGDRRYSGIVEGVGVLAEQTSRWMDPNLREYTVRITLNTEEVHQAAGKLRPSMRCEADILIGRVENAIAIPVQAIFNEGMLRYVYVPDPSGRWIRRPIRIGQRSDRFAAIDAGIDRGTRVLLRKPEPGEVLNRPWSSEELSAVGLKFDERGQIVPAQPPANPDSNSNSRK